MKIERISLLTGKLSQKDIPMTEEQLKRLEKGIEHVQDIFPELSAEDREFLISGITPEEWDLMFNEEEQ